jgi:rod shape-determining protein MreD
VRWLLGAIFFLGALLAQLLLSSAWPGSAVFFDLPLLVVIYYALHCGPSVGVSLGGAAGLIQDSLTGSLLGAGAVSRGLVGYLIGSASTRLVLTGPLPQFLIVAAGTLAARLLEVLTLVLMGRRLVPPPVLGFLAAAAGNGLVGGALFALRRREAQH